MAETLTGIIEIPHIRVQNANAVSGWLAWGFPSVTAFVGLAHALQRKLNDPRITLNGIGIVCHDFDPQTYRPAGKYHHRFLLMRHPMNKEGKPGGMAEEGRVHMEVTLLIGVYGRLDEADRQEMCREVDGMLPTMRIAGGSVMPYGKPCEYHPLGGSLEEQRQVFRTIRRRLMPGFLLVNRRDILQEHVEEMRKTAPDTNSIDALLDLVCLHIGPDTDGDKTVWKTTKRRPGWLVPLSVGYAAISDVYEPGTVANARDNTVPFRFVEGVYTLGEWISPHRIEKPDEILWYYRAEPERGLYLCDHQSYDK